MRAIIVGAVCVLAGVLALGAGAEAQNLKPLRVTIPVPAMVFYPLYVAADQGFFAKQGYAFEIISTAGDGPDIDALISGSVDFTVSTPNRLFTAYEQGKPLLAVMNLANRMGIECAMNKAAADRLGITEATPLDQKLRAMKGQTVAGTRPGVSGSSAWAQGGIAAAMDESDSADAHAADTLVAGAGLCDPAIAQLVAQEAPARLRSATRPVCQG